jgi:hypothetical protein
MKTFALRTYILALFLGSFVVACSSDDGGTSSGGTSSGDTSSGGTSSGGTSSGGTSSGATEQAGTGTVTVTREGSELVTYEVRNPRATRSGDEITFELMSDDTKHVVSVSIHGTAPGSYEVGGDGAGSAGILMYSDDVFPNPGDGSPGVFLGEDGSLSLTASDGRAVGTFTASAEHGEDGRRYEVAGSFDLPLIDGADE